MLRGEIPQLAAVFAEIVQLPRTCLAGGNQFSVAGADRPVIVVIEVEEFVRRGDVLLERRDETSAGERRGARGQIPCSIAASQFHQCGEDVHEAARVVAQLIRFSAANGARGRTAGRSSPPRSKKAMHVGRISGVHRNVQDLTSQTVTGSRFCLGRSFCRRRRFPGASLPSDFSYVIPARSGQGHSRYLSHHFRQRQVRYRSLTRGCLQSSSPRSLRDGVDARSLLLTLSRSL